jgi:light-regulated signal transduction histidine kinase (bacteriophytochrome)
MTMSDNPQGRSQSPYSRHLLDILIIAVLAVLIYGAAYFLNMNEALLQVLTASGARHAGAFILVALFLVVAFVVFMVRRWQDLTKMSDEITTVRRSLAWTDAKLMVLNNITRYDMLNELTKLHQDLEHAGANPEISLVNEAIGRIRRQIKFTKEFQDVGASPPFWQNVADAIMKAKVGIDLGTVSFEMDIHDVEIYADPLLEKVFFYLISNSQKYGGNKLSRIRIYRKKAEDRLIIVYEDNGVGISQDLKGYLFPKEWGSRKHSGYSLFLIREILAGTGITIFESGTTGEGARFEIAVPNDMFRNT